MQEVKTLLFHSRAVPVPGSGLRADQRRVPSLQIAENMAFILLAFTPDPLNQSEARHQAFRPRPCSAFPPDGRIFRGKKPALHRNPSGEPGNAAIGTLPHGRKCFFRSSPVMPASLILSSGQPEAGMSPPGSALRPCPFLPDRKAMISGPQAAGRYGADVTWITLPGKRQMNPAVLPAEVLILGVWGSTGQRGDSSRT